MSKKAGEPSGALPEGWKSASLDSLLEELISGNRPTGGGKEEGDYISLGGTQISSSGFIDLTDLSYIEEDFFDVVSKTQLRKHDVLMVKDGANTGDVAIAWEDRPDTVTNEHVLTLRIDGANPPYIFYYLLSHKGWRQLKGVITGSAQEGINKDFPGKIDVVLPSEAEQRKIASVLYTVDELIQNVDELIERLVRLKRGIRRRLLRNGTRGTERTESGTRFGKLPETWTVRALDEVANVVGGTTPSTNQDKFWGGEIPWATPSDITALEGQTIDHTPRRITDAAIDDCALTVLPPKSVLLTSRASIGEVAVNTVPMATNQGFQSLVPSEGIDSWYLFYTVSELAPYLESLGAGSTFREISNSVVKKVQAPIPPQEEQEEIAAVLRSVDRTITVKRGYKDGLSRMKKGLMQDLLSGEIRTHDVEVEIPKEVAAYG